MFRRYQRISPETEPPDLIGVMNLFMVLIPFLLLGAAFFKVAVIPSSLPTHTPQTSDVPLTPKTVTVNLVIEKDGLQLSGTSTSLTEEELADISAAWARLPSTTPGKPGPYPLDKLVAKLKEIKSYYEKSNTMIVLPYSGLEYDTLVRILDASRDYVIGKDANGEDIRADLFPVVVFSRFIPAPKDTGEGGEGGDEGTETDEGEGEGEGGEQ